MKYRVQIPIKALATVDIPKDQAGSVDEARRMAKSAVSNVRGFIDGIYEDDGDGGEDLVVVVETESLPCTNDEILVKEIGK